MQAIFSVPLATTKTDANNRCDWPLADTTAGDGLNIVVQIGDGEAALDADMAAGGSVDPINGIGDHATFGLIAGYFPHLGAVKGTATCEITIAGNNGQLSVKTTGQGPLKAIDPAAIPALQQQMGALCTQIFAGIGA